FVDTLPDPGTFTDGDFRNGNPRFVEPNFSCNVKALETFRAFCKTRGVSPATVAIAWVLEQGPHLLPIPGTRSRRHLEQLAAGESLKPTADDLAEIARCLPPGFAYGDRYTEAQWPGAERYC
ncbi:MAG: aldo/keto reductase, partial [Pseudomonadota bacterium]